MMEQAAFEIVGQEGAWNWQLRDGETHIAVGADSYDTPDEAREHVDRTRVYLTHLSGKALFDQNSRVNEPVTFHIQDRHGLCFWQLRVGDELLAVPPASYPSEDAAQNASDRVKELAAGAVPVMYKGSDEVTERDPFVLDRSNLKQAAKRLLGRGRRHRQFLDELDARIVVMGIRGKSSTTRRIGDVFNRRGYDTLVKITGNRPHILRNGDYIPIERTGLRVTLYENIKTAWQYIPELVSYTPEGIGVFENQGITEYTTRIFNQRFVQPDVILLTNIRQDHQDTLGKTRRDIARSFARSVPKGTHVISGEQHPLLHDYLEREIEKIGGTIQQVDVPDEHASLIGAETVHAVNEILEYFGMHSLPEDEVNGYLKAIQPEWTRLPGGSRIFNAAEVNDIESTEAARRALAGEEPIVPFVYLRGDRRSRTASFVNYVNTLIERNLVDTVFAGGDFTNVFAKNVDAPVTEYPADADPERVLDDLVATGLPIVLMGNTVAGFMREFEDEIEQRARRATHDGTVASVVSPEEPELEGEASISTDDDQPDRSDPARVPPTTETASTEELRSDGAESVVSGLVREFDERDLSEEERKVITENLNLSLPRHETVQLEDLQSEIARLSAYTDAMEGLFDTAGDATEILDRFEAIEENLDRVQSRLEVLEATVEVTDRRQSDIADQVETLQRDAEALSVVIDEIVQLGEETEENSARLDKTEQEITNLRGEMDDAVTELADSVSHNRHLISVLQEIEQQRLIQEIQEETAEIDDIQSLKALLAAVQQTRETEESAKN